MEGQRRATWKLALVDLDGTLYRGADGIPGAAEFVIRLRRLGIQPVFFTNNATRTPMQVCEKLANFDIESEPWEVCTSAQAAAAYLTERLNSDSTVAYLGTQALAQALEEQGFVTRYLTGAPTSSAAVGRMHPDVAAAVLGLDPRVNYAQLSEFCQLVMNLGEFVLTNADVRLPSGASFLPGNGAFGSLVQTATGIQPEVAGKPHVRFVDYALHRFGVSREQTVLIGDNLRTDVQAGVAANVHTIQVRSGVTYPIHEANLHANETYDSVAEILRQ